MSFAIFCDFDDTITRVNVTDTILERFADRQWLSIQEDWLAGKLGAREVLEKQMPLVSTRRDELDALIDSFEVDPYFADFALYCANEGHSLFILSDGFDYWIERILRRTLSTHNGALNVPVYACRLTWNGDRLVISFPYFPEGCLHGCATCKPALFDQLRAGAERAVVIGDGVSDLLLARRADTVLAKNGLKEFCHREGIACHSFDDFRGVLKIIRSLDRIIREPRKSHDVP